jgi:predicted dehydrogenase
MRVAIVGCGSIGHKRAAALGPHRLVACADVSLERAEALAAQHSGCIATVDAAAAIDRPDVDAVIVATTHDALAASGLLAAQAGKHVLIEKPASRRAAELRPVQQAVRHAGVVAKVGFNHRFHPAFRRAREIFDAGGIGPLLYIRGRYGHGGRLGYDREWRADPLVSGGGELLDQGSHLIDLSRWFAGDFQEVDGHLGTYFWQMPVEDNAFISLKTADGQVAWLHASWTEWKNLFSFEVFGRFGKLQIDGLGGSYGTERLTYYRMLPELGPPETTSWEYPGADRSWIDEFAHFADCIVSGETPSGSLEDGLAMLDIVERLYAGGPAQ